jgi:hypothetical protein
LRLVGNWSAKVIRPSHKSEGPLLLEAIQDMVSRG